MNNPLLEAGLWPEGVSAGAELGVKNRLDIEASVYISCVMMRTGTRPGGQLKHLKIIQGISMEETSSRLQNQNLLNVRGEPIGYFVFSELPIS